MKYNRIICIDPSLNCSGWALLSITTGNLLGIGKIRGLPASYNLSDRLKDLQERIHQLFISINLNENDILMCESATTVVDPSSLIKLEQVRGIFETLARNLNVLVPGRILPYSVHTEILGMKGKQLSRDVIKEMAVYTVKRLYSVQLESLGFSSDLENLKKNQDIIDAILLVHLAYNRVNSAQRTGMAIQEMFLVHSEQKRKASTHYKNSISDSD